MSEVEHTDTHDDDDVVAHTLPPMDEDLAALLGAPVVPEEEGDARVGVVHEAIVHDLDDDWVTLLLNDGAHVRCRADDVTIPGTPSGAERGATVRVLVETIGGDGTLYGSIGKAICLDQADAVEAKAAASDPVKATIRYVVGGSRRGDSGPPRPVGFAVDVDGLRGYLPGRDSGFKGAQAFDVVGQEIEVKVLGFDVERAEVRVTRRELAASEQKRREASVLESLQEGAIVNGTVTSVRDYGAFVDLGGVEGLCHVSELHSDHIESAASLVRAGQRLRVKVLEIDRERGRIRLSHREVLNDEVAASIAQIEEGAIITGTVEKNIEHGAIIRIAEGITGLCHVSELSWDASIRHADELVQPGQEVEVRVISVDPGRQRVSLSLRQVGENPWENAAQTLSTDAPVTGTIVRIEDYGIFVRLLDGIEGLCHVSELSWTGRPERPSDVGSFAVGDPIDVRILEIDPLKRRIRLSHRAIEGDPWDSASEMLTVGAIFEATVARIEETAAWLELVPGLEGRIHISELSTERVESIRSMMRVGQRVQVMTVGADRQRRRIDLSIKAIAVQEEANAPRSYSDDVTLNPLAAAFARSSEAAETEAAESKAAGTETAESKAAETET